MKDIDEIFSKLPVNEDVSVDVGREMKFCIMAHIAPMNTKKMNTYQLRKLKPIKKEDCLRVFKRLYRVLDTLPYFDRREDVFDDAPEILRSGFSGLDDNYISYGKFILKFDATFNRPNDCMKFNYFLKVAVGDSSWVDILRNGSSYKNNKFWYRVSTLDYKEMGYYAGLPVKIKTDGWISKRDTIKEGKNIFNFFRTGIYKK